MTTGVTSTGFIKKTQAQIEADIDARIRTAFGNDVDLSSNNELGQWRAIQATQLAEQWDRMEALYYSGFGTTATGISLDRFYFPIERNRAKKAGGNLQCTLSDTNGSVSIPAGSIFFTNEGVEFVTSIDYTITNNQTIFVEAREAGTAGNVGLRTIINIGSNLPGIKSVTNTAPFTNGADVESDTDFRSRAVTESLRARNSSTSAITNAIKAIPGVNNVFIDVNDTNLIKNGIPARGFRAVVSTSVGNAADAAIAKAIFDHKSIATPTAGTTGNGNVEERVSFNNQEFTIRFVRPTAVQVTIVLPITVNGDYDSVDDAIIYERIITFIGGTYNSVTYPGLGVNSTIRDWQIAGQLSEQGKPAIPGIVSVGTITLTRAGNSYVTPDPGSINFGPEHFPETSNTLITISKTVQT